MITSQIPDSNRTGDLESLEQSPSPRSQISSTSTHVRRITTTPRSVNAIDPVRDESLINDLKSKILQMSEKIILLESELDESRVELEARRKEADQRQANYDGVVNLYEKAKEVRSDTVQLEKHLETAHDNEWRNLEAYNSDLTKQANELQQIKTRFLNQFNNYQSKIQSLEDQLAETTKNETIVRSEYEDKISKLQAMYEGKHTELLKLLKAGDVEGALDEIARELKRNTADGPLSTILNELRSEISNLGAASLEIKTIRAQYLTELEGQRGLVTDLNKKIMQSERARRALSEELERSKADISHTEDRVRDVEQKYYEALTENRQQKDENMINSREVAELRTKNSAQGKLIDKGIAELGQVITHLSGLARNSEMSLELKQTRDQLAKLAETSSKLRAQLDESSQELVRLRSQAGRSEILEEATCTLSTIYHGLTTLHIPDIKSQSTIVVDRSPLRNVADEYMKTIKESLPDDSEQEHVAVLKQHLRLLEQLEKKQIADVDSMRMKFESILSEEERRHSEAMSRLHQDQKSEIQQLKDEINQLEHKYKVLESDKNQYMSQRDNYQSIIQIMEEEIKNLTKSPGKDEWESINNLHTELMASISSQKSTIEGVHTKHAESLAKLERLYDDRLTRTIEQLNASYESEIQDLKLRKRHMDESINDMTQMFKNLESAYKLVRSSDTVIDGSDEISRLQKELRSVETQLEEVSRLKTVDATLPVREQIVDLVNQVESARSALTGTVERLNSTHLPAPGGADVLKQLQEQLDKYRSAEHDSSKMAKRIKELEAAVQARDEELSRIDDFKARAEVLEREVQNLQGLLARHDSLPDTDAIKICIQNVSAILDEQKSRGSLLLSKIDDLASQFKNLKGISSGATAARLDNLQNQIAHRDDQINTLKKLLRGYKDREDSPDKKSSLLDDLRAELDVLQKEAEKDKNQLLEAINKHKESYAVVQKSYSALLNDHQNTSKELRNMIEENQKLRDLLNKPYMVNSNVNQVMSKIEELRNEYITNIEYRTQTSMAQLQQIESEYEASMEEMRLQNSGMEQILGILQSCLGRQHEALCRLSSDVGKVTNECEGALSHSQRLANSFPFELGSPRAIFSKLYTVATNLISNRIWSPKRVTTQYSSSSIKRPRFTSDVFGDSADKSLYGSSQTASLWRELSSITRES